MALARLTPERIVEAAVAILEQEGLDSLSMRRLAEALDVWPMAVYRHFRDKDALLDAVVELGIEAGREQRPGPRPGPWEERLRRLVEETAASLRRYPAPLRTRFLGPPLSEAGRRLSDEGLAILREGGLAQEDAERGWRVLLAFAAGDASLEADSAALELGVELLLGGLERSHR